MNGGDNGGLFFLDTNILVYSLAMNEPQKQPVAAALIQDALSTGRGVISTQVVQEFLNLATRWANPVFSATETVEYLHRVLWPLCGHLPSEAFFEQALQIRSKTGFHFYDSLIVAAAVQLGCRQLLSEDLQHGRKIHGVTILNPFAVEQ
jgi:predicted nucleic acid-binding protein